MICSLSSVYLWPKCRWHWWKAELYGYILRWFICPQIVTHPSSNHLMAFWLGVECTLSQFFLYSWLRTPVIALPCWWLGTKRSCPALLRAMWTPQFWGWTSSSTVPNQAVLGRPAGLLWSARGQSTAAMIRRWSSAGAVRARWPKNLRWWDLATSETGEQQVMSRS